MQKLRRPDNAVHPGKGSEQSNRRQHGEVDSWTAVRSCPLPGFPTATVSLLEQMRFPPLIPGHLSPFVSIRTRLALQSINGAVSVLTHLAELFREMGTLESNPPVDSSKEGLLVKPAALHSAIG